MSATVETDGGLQDTEGEPGLSELSIASRLMVLGSVASDLVMRTAAASAVSVPGLLWAFRDDPRRQRHYLPFYRELADMQDPELAFPAPESTPRITSVDPPRFSFDAPDGTVSMLRFDTPFQAVNPDMRAHYANFAENSVAWAQHWRHDDGPRPTLVVIHGFGASPYWLNSAFFSLPWLYKLGYDVLLYLLPFHGVRQARLTPFSGWGLFAHGPAHLNEAIAHAVHDFRIFLDHLESDGVDRIAVTGVSLGGYMSALVAAVDPRIQVVVPNAPVTNLAEVIRQWFPANALLVAGSHLRGIDLDEAEAALAAHCPLNYAPMVPFERRMIIGGLGDRLAPPEQARWLWEHWGRCRLHWFPGSHFLHLRRGTYLKEMLAFMRAAGVGP